MTRRSDQDWYGDQGDLQMEAFWAGADKDWREWTSTLPDISPTSHSSVALEEPDRIADEGHAIYFRQQADRLAEL